MASQSFLDDQLELKDAIAIGWAEDNCNGFQIVRIRVVDKDFAVRTKLLDLSLAPDKKAVRKIEDAKASIREALHECEADVVKFCELVKARV